MNLSKICVSSLIFWATAAPAQGSFALYGAGTASCGQYLSQTATGDADFIRMYEGWLQGFLSGMNVASRLRGGEMVLLPEVRSLLPYMTRYCRENPSSTFMAGSMTLARDFNLHRF